MFCPSCGKEIPDSSRFCLACGKSSAVTVARADSSAVADAPEGQSSWFRNILIGVVIAFVALVLFNVLRDGGATRTVSSQPLTPPAFNVQPGTIQYLAFTVPRSAQVIGRFEASGGDGNDIQPAIA